MLSERIPKSSTIAEALGSLDEANSFLGLCKVQSGYIGLRLDGRELSEIVHEMQKNLFTIQAEVAGAERVIAESKVKELEEIVDSIKKELPPAKSFYIPGGPFDITKWQQGGAGLGALFDFARTIVRRAERKVVMVSEEKIQLTLNASGEESENKRKQISEQAKNYLNKLSSALYVLARYVNYKTGIMEEAPDYR